MRKAGDEMKDFLIDNISSILLGVVLVIALVICVVQRIKMHRQNKKYGFNEYVNEDHGKSETAANIMSNSVLKDLPQSVTGVQPMKACMDPDILSDKEPVVRQVDYRTTK
ncbi:MAG: hypothetical protein LKJ83_08630 [Eubacteriaceae bacterium]|nr:hypothetical protein [Eubacteriaceae bacterium]